MKTDKARQALKYVSQQSQENLRNTNTRRTSRVIQETATDQENLMSSSKLVEKDIKLASSGEKPKKQFCDKSVQTDGVDVTVTAEDLTSDSEPSEAYWMRLARKRGEMLERTLTENERFKENVETLLEENRICKEMLDETRNLVEVLQEMIPIENASND